MAYKHALVVTPPIDVDGWRLSFGWRESTGGVPNSANQYDSVNFTCASAVMWNVNFTRISDNYNMYSHAGTTLVPDEVRHKAYDQLVERFKDNTYMVQLVGVVNGGTPARELHYLHSENKHGYHTYDFANYLISKKIGVVVESPVFVNTYHKWEGPSICQAWFWFSPSIINECALVQDTGGIHGLENVKKFLHDSPINKKAIGSFDNLLAAPLVVEPRFQSAADKWNASMKKQQIDLSPTKDQRFAQWVRK